ncbi:MAG: YkgJ family cysteine cluster protein [Lachnospiraceae bacterium]|nr:YkgJ family cysteine cluster protein [Lachnospiraceae bacterium]
MRRKVRFEEISDGRLYGLNDMVKADCGDCKGCSACCQGMGESIVLDPLDVHRLAVNLGAGFEQLMERHIELHVVDGLILPNLKLAGADERCTFLNEQGRCGIHGFRPGICRLFPLGRYYEGRSFQYFLQVHECRKENRAKVKVKKWIDTPDSKAYERFVNDWHYFLEDLDVMLSRDGDEGMRKGSCMYVLRQFYMTPFDGEQDFYGQFQERLERARADLGV